MKRARDLIPIAAWLAVACGSTSLSPAAARIREAEPSDLSDCTLLQRVTGKASDDDANAELHAKNKAREQAASLGATHIRWIVPCCTSVEAEAYRCDVPTE